MPDGTIFLLNRSYLWLMLRRSRWQYKRKRCKTRSDKAWEKHVRRTLVALERQEAETPKLAWSQLTFQDVPVVIE